MTCDYQECVYENWSPWSQSCGSITRTRQLKTAYNRTKIQHGGCSGLLTKCEQQQKEDQILEKCPREIFVIYFFNFLAYKIIIIIGSGLLDVRPILAYEQVVQDTL